MAETEVAWVIECTDHGPPLYWTGRKQEWSFNYLAALRFARRQDAKRALGWLIEPTNLIRIVEHMSG